MGITVGYAGRVDDIGEYSLIENDIPRYIESSRGAQAFVNLVIWGVAKEQTWF